MIKFTKEEKINRAGRGLIVADMVITSKFYYYEDKEELKSLSLITIMELLNKKTVKPGEWEKVLYRAIQCDCLDYIRRENAQKAREKKHSIAF